MQTIFELLGMIPFGHITLIFGLSVLVLLVLRLLNDLATHALYLLLALDTEGAPDFNLPKYVDKVLGLFYNTNVFWVATDEEGYYRHTSYDSIRTTELCETNKYSNEHKVRTNDWFSYKKQVETKSFNWDIAKYALITDVGLFCFQLLPSLTIIVTTTAFICWGVRFLAKKVWQNTSKLTTHEERLDKLEER